MLVVICGVEVLHRTTKKDIYLILLIGALSIVINALVFPTANANFYANYGRFSGFYLNPNFAGSICLVGYALSYVMTNKILRLSGQILFTLGGILTLSRTFFVIWLLVNIVAVYKDRKNFIAPIFGALVLVMILTFSAGLTLNTERFTALKSIFGSENIKTKTIAKDSRTDTWSLYTDMILDKPFFGNGYQKFQLRQSGLPGVHNSYLMVLGEAGIIPFLFITGIYLYILIKSYKIFAASPELFYVSLVVAIALLTGHGYFSNYYNVMISMYVFIQLRLTSEPIQVPQKKPLSEFFLEN
jgi:O-antigen ligase